MLKIKSLSKEDITLLKRSFEYLKLYKGFFILNLIVVLLLMVAELVQPLFFGKIIDYVIAKEINLVWGVIVKIIGLVVVIGILNFLQTYIAAYLTNNIIFLIKKDLYKHLLSLSVGAYDQLRVGELISRLEGDVGTLSNIIILQFTKVIVDVIKLLGIGVIIFKINRPLSMAIVLFFPLTYLVSNFFGRILRRKNKFMKKYNDSYFSFITETFAGFREVKALNIESTIYDKFVAYIKKYTSIKIRYSLISTTASLISRWLNSFIGILTIILGSYQIIFGYLSIGNFIAFNQYSGRFKNSLDSISKLNSNLHQSLVALERIFSIFDNILLPIEKSEGFVPAKVESVIKFNDVSFGYDKNLQFLRDINFTIQPGQVTALVGRSGSGKTTILKLLLRFYQPNKGGIYLDNHVIDELDLNFLRNQIAIVPQEPFLFNISIGENLLLVNPTATIKDLEEVARKANIYSFIVSLPEGFDTIIGERGVRLSGGQKQRIAIARALLKGAKIILLDEATSALDGESESRILDTIKGLLPEYTIVAVAHRLSSIKHADQIIVLSEGRVVGTGQHRELYRSNETYKNLYSSQSEL